MADHDAKVDDDGLDGGAAGPAPVADPARGTVPSDGGPEGDRPGGDDDEIWSEVDASAPRTTLWLQIGLVVVALLVVAFLFLRDDGDADSDQADGSPDATDVAGGGAGGTGPVTPARPPTTWPRSVGGRPAAFGDIGDPPPATTDAAPGVYFWSDFDGFHVWVVGGAGKAAASGTVTSNDNIAKAAASVEGQGTVTAEGPIATFDLGSGTGAVVGIDLNPGFFCNQLTLDLGGTDLPLFTGAEAAPADSPASVTRAREG